MWWCLLRTQKETKKRYAGGYYLPPYWTVSGPETASSCPHSCQPKCHQKDPEACPRAVPWVQYTLIHKSTVFSKVNDTLDETQDLFIEVSWFSSTLSLHPGPERFIIFLGLGLTPITAQSELLNIPIYCLASPPGQSLCPTYSLFYFWFIWLGLASPTLVIITELISDQGNLLCVFSTVPREGPSFMLGSFLPYPFCCCLIADTSCGTEIAPQHMSYSYLAPSLTDNHLLF